MTNMYIGSLFISFGIDYIMEIPNWVSSIASIVFNGSFGLENYIYWTC